MDAIGVAITGALCDKLSLDAAPELIVVGCTAS